MSDIEPGKELAAESAKVALIPAAAAPAGGGPKQGMFGLVMDLIRPYRKWLIIVFIAMLVETGTTLRLPGR